MFEDSMGNSERSEFTSNVVVEYPERTMLTLNIRNDKMRGDPGLDDNDWQAALCL